MSFPRKRPQFHAKKSWQRPGLPPPKKQARPGSREQGLPSSGSLKHADALTLARALEGRRGL